jgi:hypothetical protein
MIVRCRRSMGSSPSPTCRGEMEVEIWHTVALIADRLVTAMVTSTTYFSLAENRIARIAAVRYAACRMNTVAATDQTSLTTTIDFFRPRWAGAKNGY